MTKKPTFIALLLPMILTACATQSPESVGEVQPLPDSKVCCADYSTFPWIQLGSNEELSFQVNTASPVGHFSEGNSYFNAFRLSERSARVTLRLSSIMSNGEVFAPKLMTLDHDFNVVNVNDIESFELVTSNAFTRNQYQLNFALDATKTPYFIVYTNGNDIGHSVQVPHPARVRSLELGEPMPMVTDPKYVYSQVGELELSVKTVSLASGNHKEPLKPTKPVMNQKIEVQTETQEYYYTAIRAAVSQANTSKALALLDEAKALGVSGAQEVFVDAVNSK